jgi:hypothetical protein
VYRGTSPTTQPSDEDLRVDLGVLGSWLRLPAQMIVAVPLTWEFACQRLPSFLTVFGALTELRRNMTPCLLPFHGSLYVRLGGERRLSTPEWSYFVFGALCCLRASGGLREHST